MYWRQLLIPAADGRSFYICPTRIHRLQATTPRGKCSCYVRIRCDYLQAAVVRFGCCGDTITIRKCLLHTYCTVESNDGLIEYLGVPVASCVGCKDCPTCPVLTP